MTKRYRVKGFRSQFDDVGANHVPTPAEIRRACDVIRAGWTPKERRLRWVGPAVAPWTPPEVTIAPMEESASD